MTNKLKSSPLKYLFLVTNKLKSSQLKYLLLHIILMLFEELCKVTGLAVHFSNF